MKLIRTVEVKYFRSVYVTKLKSCNAINVISGRNDVGKSNLLRGLNLFFNGETEWQHSLVFSRDFSVHRLDQVRKESVKGKQFIQVSIEFERPSNYKGSLPEKFLVRRTWHRDQEQYTQTDNLNALFQAGKCPSTLKTAQRMLSNFLNRIHYEYVPAVKDRNYYNHLLSRLQSSLLGASIDGGNPIAGIADDLAEHIGQHVHDLRTDFERATGLSTNFQPPSELAGLFQAFDVSIPSSSDAIPLVLRGDGMQARYAASVLHYIAKNSSSFFVWGFEEPENSLEYSVADSLAEDFQELYSKDAQIFLTSHSPAIVSRRGEDVSCYRVHQENERTVATLVSFPLDESKAGRELSKEIGLLRIQQEVHDKYKKQLDDLEAITDRTIQLESELDVVNLF